MAMLDLAGMWSQAFSPEAMAQTQQAMRAPQQSGGGTGFWDKFGQFVDQGGLEPFARAADYYLAQAQQRPTIFAGPIHGGAPITNPGMLVLQDLLQRTMSRGGGMY